MNDLELSAQLQGLLFAIGRPLAKSDAAQALGVDEAALHAAINTLAKNTDSGIILLDDGKELELRLAPSVAPLIEKVRKEEYSRDIGRAGLEVLAAVLYRGPLSRADIDFIRGVNSSATLRTLSMRGLVRRTSNPKDERSFLYEPTTELFAEMGITHARDLPDFAVVKEKLIALERAYKEGVSSDSAS